MSGDILHVILPGSRSVAAGDVARVLCGKPARDCRAVLPRRYRESTCPGCQELASEWVSEIEAER